MPKKIDLSFEEIIRFAAVLSVLSNEYGLRMLARDTGGNPVELKVAPDGTLYTNTTATATFSDKHEDIVKVSTDFNSPSKTAAQTWDNPHVAKVRAASTFDAPSNAGFTEFSTGGYTNIAVQADGNVQSSSDSTNANYRQHLFQFDLLTIARRTFGIPASWTVSDLVANIKSLTITWVGYGVGANAAVATNGANVKFWQPGSSSWSAGVSNTATSPVATLAAITNVANVIDASGILNILAHSTYPSDGSIASTIYTDYVKVDMQLIGDNLNTLSAGIDPTSGRTKAVRVGADGALTLSDRYELLVTRQTDFAGKTAGQTYDVPHIAKATSTANNLTDAPSSTNYTETNGTGYSQVQTPGDGGLFGSTNTTNGCYARHLFSFDLLTVARRTPGIPSNWTVADLKANLKALQITWVGYGVGANGGSPANGATFKMWNDGSASYDTITTNAGSGLTQVGSGVLTNNARVDANGFVHALLHTAYPSDGVNPSTIYTDYIKVEMTLIGTTLNDQATHNVEEQNIGVITVAAGATTAIASGLDVSRCTDYVVAVNPSATHTYSVLAEPLGRDNAALVATADRTSVIASASQGKKLSAKVAVVSPRVTLYVTNGDASSRDYYGRFIRLGTKGARQS